MGLSTGETDYLLFVDRKAAGVVEAKPEGSSLTTAETQSQKYLSGLSARVPHYRLPLPFEYRSDGTHTHFTNDLEPNARSREVFSFHRPEELLRLVRQESQLRENLRDMPELDTTGLWDVQVRAITNLEKSLSDNKPRALVQMATGSSKTFTPLTPLTDDGILSRKPVQTVSTVGFSALMAGDLLHTVVIPSEMLTEPLKPFRIKLASHVIGLGKSGHAEPRPIVWIVTVRRTVE